MDADACVRIVANIDSTMLMAAAVTWLVAAMLFRLLPSCSNMQPPSVVAALALHSREIWLTT
jgi:hypothetical protein